MLDKGETNKHLADKHARKIKQRQRMGSDDKKLDVVNRGTRRGATWTNDEKIELIKLRLQGLTFGEIGSKISRTRHAARSEYGRIRRGETDVTVSLKELPELRKALPHRRA